VDNNHHLADHDPGFEWEGMELGKEERDAGVSEERAVAELREYDFDISKTLCTGINCPATSDAL
jgi:hypothetical protein